MPNRKKNDLTGRFFPKNARARGAQRVYCRFAPPGGPDVAAVVRPDSFQTVAIASVASKDAEDNATSIEAAVVMRFINGLYA